MQIINYIGYITPTTLFVHGRVLKNRPIKVSIGDGFLKNIWNSLRRSLTREIKNQPLHVDFDGTKYLVKTDNEGYFSLRESLRDTDVKREWRLAYIEHQNTRSIAPLFPFHNDKRIGIISDIDDTILETGAGGFLMLGLIWRSLTQNIFKRQQVDKMSALYSYLNEKCGMAICYLSNSPTNFNNLLRHFLSHNNFPSGPLFLRDYGLPTARQRAEMRNHKKKVIQQLIEDNPDMSWICIGDDTSHDLDVYREAQMRFPDHVVSIHIRNTNKKSYTGLENETIYQWKSTQMLSDQLDQVLDHRETRG